MKAARRGPPAAPSGRSAARPRPPRRPRPRPAAPALPFRTPEQRRWFEAEAAASSRLAHTARLAGDFVAAQRLEGELASFTEETRRLLGAGGADDEATYEEQGEHDKQVYRANDGVAARIS